VVLAIAAVLQKKSHSQNGTSKPSNEIVLHQKIFINLVFMYCLCWTVTGLSDAERDEEPAVPSLEPFVEQHYVSTPVMTPPKSVTPTLRTLSPSLPNEAPAIRAATEHPPTLPVTQPPPASKTQAVKMIDAATECVL